MKARFVFPLMAVGAISFATIQAAEKAAAPNATPATKKPATPPAAPVSEIKPTLANVPYGAHERQVLDFYQANSDKPTPVLLHIHGGGWVTGDKAKLSVKPYLDAGISVVSINYRYSTQADLAGVHPPVKWPLEDAVRALQFVRSNAKQWNLDKARIGAVGGSAGACSSLYLAFHDDFAKPDSQDPVERESTRLWCAGVSGAQTTLDPKQMFEWTPNSRYGGHAFGFMADPNDLKTRDKSFAEFLEKRETVLEFIKKYSPYEHASSDDPAIYLHYSTPPNLGKEEKDPTHTANFGVKLKERLDELKVPNELFYPGAPGLKHASIASFMIETLKAPKSK